MDCISFYFKYTWSECIVNYPVPISKLAYNEYQNINFLLFMALFINNAWKIIYFSKAAFTLKKSLKKPSTLIQSAFHHRGSPNNLKNLRKQKVDALVITPAHAITAHSYNAPKKTPVGFSKTYKKGQSERTINQSETYHRERKRRWRWHETRLESPRRVAAHPTCCYCCCWQLRRPSPSASARALGEWR